MCSGGHAPGWELHQARVQGPLHSFAQNLLLGTRHCLTSPPPSICEESVPGLGDKVTTDRGLAPKSLASLSGMFLIFQW